jgi:Restriction endonuclease
MNKNTGYEKFIQGVYQALLESEGLKNVNVVHNIKIAGRSGCQHQIDVYWEYEIVGGLYRVAIECKNYKSKVKVGRIRDFFGVLYDIGNINGILVTKRGYERGVIQFADYYKINLVEAKAPPDIVINLTGFGIQVTNRTIYPDGNWLLKEGKIKPTDTEFAFKFGGQLDTETNIYDSSGQKITDFYRMKSELLGRHWSEQQDLKEAFTFEDGWIDTLDVGRIKITHVVFTYNILSATTTATIKGEETGSAIVREVKTNKIRMVEVKKKND